MNSLDRTIIPTASMGITGFDCGFILASRLTRDQIKTEKAKRGPSTAQPYTFAGAKV